MGKGGYCCAIDHCKNNSKKTTGVSFFFFPKDIKRAKIWLAATNRVINCPIEKLCKNYKICGSHFSQRMFKNDLKNRLFDHAYPDINIESELKILDNHVDIEHVDQLLIDIDTGVSANELPIKTEAMNEVEHNSEAIIEKHEDGLPTLMGRENIITAMVKSEPEWENFESELGFPACKQETDSIFLAEKLIEENEKDGITENEVALDSYHVFLPEIKEELVENEYNDGITEKEWEIKQEVTDVKEEDFESNEVGMSSSCFDQAKQDDYAIWMKNINNEFIDDTKSLHDFNCESTADTNSLTDTLVRHKRSVDVFNCNECHFQTAHKRSLRRHLLKHKELNEGDTRIYKCYRCSFKTIHETALKRHRKTHKKHKKVDKFKCDQCNFKTIHERGLKCHRKIHKKPNKVKKPEKVDGTLKCTHCNFQTQHQFDMKRHLLQHENSDEVKSFKCDECEYQTVHKFNFNRHSVTHRSSDEVYSFKCNQCSYQTVHRGDLKMHSMLHTIPERVSLIKCGHCKFITKDTTCLIEHLLSHKKSNCVD